MRTRVFLFLFLVVLAAGLVAAVPTGAAEKVDADQITKLIEQLGSGDFAERERAYLALDKIGADALDALRRATKSDDAEIRRRAEDLVAKWEKIAERDKILKPTMLRLTFKDTPLPEALDTVRQKTGLQIYLHDPENKLANRKVTVDTGELTLWQAFDLFCEKAGLTDGDPSQVTPTGTTRPTTRPVIRLAPGVVPGVVPAIVPAPAVIPPPAVPAKEDKKEPAPAKKPDPAPAPQKGVKEGTAANFLAPLLFAAMTMQVIQLEVPPGGFGPMGKPGFNPYAPNQVLLVDGTAKKQPVDYAGAVRIRALSSVANLPLPRTEKDILLGLQVMPEPRLALQSIVGVTVEKAIDDQGQRLSQAMEDMGENGNNVVVGPGGAVIIRGRIISRYPGAVGNQVGLKLQKGEKPSKSLKELKGTVTAQIRSAPSEMMAVEKLLEAKGQKATAEGGGNLEILNVGKNEDGSYAVEVKLETPTGALAVNPGTIPGAAGPTTTTVVLPGGLRRALSTGGYVGLLITDAKGNRLPMTLTKSAGNRAAGGPMEYGFQVVPQAGQGEPAKISFTGAMVVGVDIPFTLKDVPIP